MLEREFFYSTEPKERNVSKAEFDDFIKNYPRKLSVDVCGICEPPSITYNDFELANRWPYSVVANTFSYDKNPESPFYIPEERRKYSIIENFEEVFQSKTGNMAK